MAGAFMSKFILTFETTELSEITHKRDEKLQHLELNFAV